MDLSSVLADFIQKDGVAVAILFFGAWFLTMKVWPFLTREYWPAASERAKTQVTVLSGLADAVVALKVISQQQMAMLADHGKTLGEIQVALAGLSVAEKDNGETK